MKDKDWLKDCAYTAMEISETITRNRSLNGTGITEAIIFAVVVIASFISASKEKSK